jgi:hypothetical protein
MAFANFSITDVYTAIFTKLNAQLTASAGWFKDQTTGDFDGQVRRSSANKRLEYWNSGTSAWAELDISLQDNATANAALPASSYTAADVLAKMVTSSNTSNGVTVQTAGSAGSCSGNAATATAATTATNSAGTGTIPKTTENSIRIVRGSIAMTGTITGGSGFTVSKSGTGQFVVTFTSAFSVAPSIIVSSGYNYNAYYDSLSGSGFRINTGYSSGAWSLNDANSSFVAIGTI